MESAIIQNFNYNCYLYIHYGLISAHFFYSFVQYLVSCYSLIGSFIIQYCVHRSLFVHVPGLQDNCSFCHPEYFILCALCHCKITKSTSSSQCCATDIHYLLSLSIYILTQILTVFQALMVLCTIDMTILCLLR